MMKEFWNQRYAEEAFSYGTEPNSFLVEQLQGLPPAGRLFLPMEGEGRNAVFASKLGWAVHAMDFSEEGKRKARALATKEKVSFTYELGDLKTYNIPTEIQVCALIFAHLPPDLRKRVHQAISQHLVEGGRVIVEAFHPNQLNYSSGGPQKADMLTTLEQLVSDFETLEMIVGEEREVDLNEGPYHQGKAFVTRYVGVKT